MKKEERYKRWEWNIDEDKLYMFYFDVMFFVVIVNVVFKMIGYNYGFLLDEIKLCRLIKWLNL